VADIVSQVLCALSHCHALEVIHRDVKPGNVMLTELDSTAAARRKSRYHATLIDFGCAARTQDGGLREAAGTPAYIAPEMLVADPRYNAKVDVWSCGVCAFEMLTGTVPFGRPSHYGGDVNKVYRKIRSYKRSKNAEEELAAIPQWEHLSEDARDFLRCVLAADPDMRPTANEAGDHKWLANNKNRSPRKGKAGGA